ncbi:uncharacterized protein LOC101850074 isoform X2 [Aplysia californica]|uniref:Uncharacterized protein LOC101850074 isoform X2 n=1 Tax=Aplysia californica TaxID=6500 RepID=A0ABM0JIW5_APLCA|nr:uncharacterized protein LOC101850074 isoform X2 [Aplysia californica]
MSQGNGRRDKGGGYAKKRRPGYELNQSQRGCAPGDSLAQLPFQPSGMANLPAKPFMYWHQRGYPPPHNFRNNHGPQFPGHQVFMQHRPFGNNSGPFRMGVFPHHFPPRGHPGVEHRQPAYFVREHAHARGGYNVHQDRQWGRSNSDGCDTSRGDNGYHRNDQGARPKTGKYGGVKRYHYKGKKNSNNSSNVPSKTDTSDNMTTPRNLSGCERRDTPTENKADSEIYETALVSGGAGNSSACKIDSVCETNSIDSALEGAVGGVDTSHANSNPLPDPNPNPMTGLDNNLIDEGAICDLDRMFQSQEYSRVNGQCFEDLEDSESDFHPGRSENGVCSVSSDDEDSELDNCEYTFRTDHIAGRTSAVGLFPQADMNSLSLKLGSYAHGKDPSKSCKTQETSSGLCSWNGPNCHREPAERNEGNVENFEDGEDTGDFIDTDLPSHNKHLLSSSDEMDNNSSSSDHDEEDQDEKFLGRKKCGSDFNCNDLSSIGNKVQNEFEDLLICDDNSGKLLSSHKQCSATQEKLFRSLGDEHICGASHNVGRLTPPRKSAKDDALCSSSESENGDHAPLHPGLPDLCLGVGAPHGCEDSVVDGAAASQLYVDGDSLASVCFPGADCELPPSSPSSQCFHSNLFCPYSISGRGEDKSRSNRSGSHGHPSPCRGHAALTASSELCSHGHGHIANPDSGSPSTAADGGACCPSSNPHPRLTNVNDLNIFCHHSHSHVANGFNSDSPRANFSNDESNRHQKVFVKFPIDTKVDEGSECHSASSGDFEEDGSSLSGKKKDKGSNSSGGSEDPLCSELGDNVDMVLLPMEEEIEPVHLGGLCAGGGVIGGSQDGDDLYEQHFGNSAHFAGGLGSGRPTNVPHGFEDHPHLLSQDENPLGSGMPSKEFYELIKTVSTTETCMRFFDKDGVDVQRQPLNALDDEGDEKEDVASGGQGSKTERLKVDKVMIWNEYEAYVMQFKQIAVSACGQTAVLNVLKALNIPCEKASVCKIIKTSLRKEDACIPEYLFSRACAGTTAEELMAGVEQLSQGEVGGRFFHFWPPRKVKLLQWLAYWMNRGAIPMATLNLQQGPHSLWQVPDSWHHQMVYGVSPQGLYLTNPLEIVSERSAMRQLCSDSVLMVRRQDVISRFRESADLRKLLSHSDPRWRTMNVLGQVVNVLREFNLPTVPGYRLQVTSHVSIPASYKAGITLFMRKDKAAWAGLLNAPDIPLEQ